MISKNLYEAVLDSMAKRPLRIGVNGNENDHADSEHTVGLLEILPEIEKVSDMTVEAIVVSVSSVIHA